MKNGLRLMEFSPDDYRIADILSEAHLEKVSDRNRIAAAFSLYFQWKEYRRCLANLGDGNYLDCELEVDQDLAFPSEIVVSVKSSSAINVSKVIRIRFEIFKTCFEFSAPVIANFNETDGVRYIVDIPFEIYLHKARTTPRYSVPINSPIRKCKWTSNDGKISEVEIIEINVKVLHIKSNNQELDESGTIDINGHRFKTKFIRKTKSGLVVQLIFENQREYGVFFDQFIKVAYPDLRPRYDFTSDQIYNLYLETGYLSSFGGNDNWTETDEQNRKELLSQYWKNSEDEEHVVKVDYVLVDQSGEPSGSSGLAKIFTDQGKQIWAFHQLCSKKESNLLSGTGHLSCWRAEYLAGLSGPLDVVVWYKASSKWIERLFTKLSIANPRNTKLEAVYLKRCYREKCEDERSVIRKDNNRREVKSEGIFIGSNPEFLNASRLFELIWIRKDSILQTQLDSALKLYNEISVGNLFDYYGVSLPYTVNLLQERETRPTDRCFQMQPVAFIDFINSVEHSIAVTKKKLDKR